MNASTDQSSEDNPNPQKKVAWGKWGIVALVIIGLIVASRMLPVGEWLQEINAWLEDLGPIGVLIFIGLYMLATVLFMPGAVFTIAAGAAFGLGWGFLGASIGSTAGAAIAFLVGRYLARDRVKAALDGRPKFDAIDRAIGEKGWKIIFLLRLSPAIPFNLSNYFYGLTAVRFWPYVLASWIAMMPGTLLYVYIGTASRAALEAAATDGVKEGSTMKTVFMAIGLVATVIVTIYVTKIARKALKEVEPEVVKSDKSEEEGAANSTTS